MVNNWVYALAMKKKIIGGLDEAALTYSKRELWRDAVGNCTSSAFQYDALAFAAQSFSIIGSKGEGGSMLQQSCTTTQEPGGDFAKYKSLF